MNSFLHPYHYLSKYCVIVWDAMNTYPTGFGHNISCCLWKQQTNLKCTHEDCFLFKILLCLLNSKSCFHSFQVLNNNPLSWFITTQQTCSFSHFPACNSIMNPNFKRVHVIDRTWTPHAFQYTALFSKKEGNIFFSSYFLHIWR